MEGKAIRILDLVDNYVNTDSLTLEDREELIGWIVEILEEHKREVKLNIVDRLKGVLRVKKVEEESLGGKSFRLPIIESIDYTVQKGDTLWGIAKKYYENGYMWRVIYLENKKIIGDNPDLIIPGMTLTLRFWRNE